MNIESHQSMRSNLIKNQAEDNQQIENIRNLNNNNQGKESDEKLKKAIADFSAVFLKLMFKSMRSTLPENKYIDGGYAEEVFTDMMDKKVSELGSGQSTFKNLNRAMFEQLDQTK